MGEAVLSQHLTTACLGLLYEQVCSAGPKDVAQASEWLWHVTCQSHSECACEWQNLQTGHSHKLAVQGCTCCRVNKREEPMLTNMNLIAHEHYSGVYY